MRLPLRLSVSTLLLATLVVPALALADTTTEAEFISDTNHARAGHGLRSYAVSGDLTSVARRWAAHMARTHTLEHNPSYSSEVCCWREIGENVGVGPSESQIQSAFMASSPHRANILSSAFTQLGVGTARDSSGRLYVDELFRRPSGSAVAAPVAAPAPMVRVRVSAPRATRMHRRPALVVRRHPTAAPQPSAAVVLGQRLAVAERETPKQAGVDPVLGALAFVRVMAVLDGSAN